MIKFILIFIILEFAAILALAVLYFRIFKKKLFEESKKNAYRSSNGGANVSMFEDKLQNLERKMGELTQKVNELQKKIDKNKDKEIEQIDCSETINENIKYLKGKSGKTFSRVEDSLEGANWRMINIKGETAQFDFCGTIETARSNYNAIFDNVSETTGDVQNARKVETTVKGTIKLMDNKWEVTIPAKIKFI